MMILVFCIYLFHVIITLLHEPTPVGTTYPRAFIDALFNAFVGPEMP